MRKTLLASSLVMLLLGSLLPAHAVPPVLAGAMATDNVDFVANIPDRGAVGARILGDLLYETTATGLRIYDISLGVPVLQGALPLPHFENENVAVADRPDGKRVALVSQDMLIGFPLRLYVIDVTDPNRPLLTATIETSAGHTAACVQGCTYIWQTGSGPGVNVIDLHDLANPVELGQFSADGCFGCVDDEGREIMEEAHNVNVDTNGLAWVSAYGGLYSFDTTPEAYGPGNLLSPTLVTATCGGCGDAGAFHDDFIIHNSLHPDAEELDPAKLDDANIDPGELVLVTEENWLAVQNDQCTDEGQFQTGWMHKVDGELRVDNIDRFLLGQGLDPTTQNPLAGLGTCSSHWFDEDAGIVADAWYEQGIRFLDVSDPRDIRQIGYFLVADSMTSIALFHRVTDGPAPGLYVYGVDYSRGLDVLRFTGQAGDPEAFAPRLNPVNLGYPPSPQWGYACRLVSAAA